MWMQGLCPTGGENNTRDELVPINDSNECSISYRLPQNNGANREWQHNAIRSLISDTSFGSSLKFAMLIGLFTLQGSQQAIASTDFSTGLQSLPFLGDFGDISTGFASVRKISLLTFIFHFVIKTLKNIELGLIF